MGRVAGRRRSGRRWCRCRRWASGWRRASPLTYVLDGVCVCVWMDVHQNDHRRIAMNSYCSTALPTQNTLYKQFVLDAPNIAYYGQNFGEGRFSFQQIDLVLQALKAQVCCVCVPM